MMSKQENAAPPPSLISFFEGPENFRGMFGWVAGFSANASFMDRAAELFMRQPHAQRAYGGKVSLVTMLAPHTGSPQIQPTEAPEIQPTEAPGVLHVGL